MSSNLPLSDDDVHAYADGKLPEERRARLAAALARDPALAAVTRPFPFRFRIASAIWLRAEFPVQTNSRRLVTLVCAPG